MGGQKMHQTTVRFGADLWRALEEECSGLGVSVAQFVREAALARLMYVAGRRGDPDYDLALGHSGAAMPESRPGGPVESALEQSLSEMSQSSALWAQGRLARHRARELRDASERRRGDS
jgi:hypothetical protein